MLAAVFVGLLSPALPPVAGQNPMVTVIELPMTEFGIMAGKIAWVIALAALIGTAMMESGAAEQIVNQLLKTLGEKRGRDCPYDQRLCIIYTGFFRYGIFLTDTTGNHPCP
jgi:H+/gluconate symporter-like permease